MSMRRKRSTPLRTGARDAAAVRGRPRRAARADVIDRSVTLLEERQDVDGMDRAFLAAARSLLRLLVDPRSYRRAMAAIARPGADGAGRRATGWCPVAAARDIAAPPPATGATSSWPGVGHVPQLQVPERLATEVLGWLDDDARRPARPPDRVRTAGAQGVAQRLEPGVARPPAQLLARLRGVHDRRPAGRLHPLGDGRQERQAGERPGRGLRRAGRQRDRQRAELPGHVGRGEDAVAGDVVGARAARRRRCTARSARPTSSSWMNCIRCSGTNTGTGSGSRRGRPNSLRPERGQRAGQDVLAADRRSGPSTTGGRSRKSASSGCAAGLAREQLLQLGLLLRVEQPGRRPGRPVLVDRRRVVGVEAVGRDRRGVDEPAGPGGRRGPEGVERAVDVDRPGRLAARRCR